MFAGTGAAPFVNDGLRIAGTCPNVRHVSHQQKGFLQINFIGRFEQPFFDRFRFQ
jgi:hypothetical protein